MFSCEVCDFKCSKQSEWTRHLSTLKHKNRTFSNQKNAETKPTYKCSGCNKEYSAKNSLWYHKKKCATLTEKLDAQPVTVIGNDVFKRYEDLTEKLVKQNEELHNKIIQITSQPKTVTNNITNNNQFNLNMFLNEECKNAPNIMDFIRSLNLTIEDIEETGRLGFIEGMTRIFVKALQDIDVTMRPIHCTDSKRETVYIKDEDHWEKENKEKGKLKTAVRHIAKKNLQLLPEWQEQNPDYRILDTPENEKYLQISLNSLGAYSEEASEKQEDKIVKNILKKVTIDRGESR
jgi:hypothetical protein